MEEYQINKLSFLSFALLFSLLLRTIVDGIGLGFSIALFIFFVFLFLIFTKYKFNKNALLTVAPILLFSFWGYWLAVYHHHEPFFALRGFVRYSSYAMVFLIAFHSDVKFKHIYNVYTIVLLIQVVATLYQRLILGVPRPPGLLLNNNHINYLLIPYFSITFLYYKKYTRSFLIFLYSLFLGGLGGSILLLFIGSVNVFMKTKGLVKLLGIALIPLFIFLFSLMLDERIEEQRTGMTQLEERLASGKAGGDGGSLLWRIVTWKLMVDELVEKKGLFFGQGIDYASNASPYFLSASSREPHNDYVRNLLEFGLVGLVLYVFLYYRYLYFFLKNRKDYLMANSMFYSLLALAIGQLSGNIISQMTLWWFVFAFSGVYLRIYQSKTIYNGKITN